MRAKPRAANATVSSLVEKLGPVLAPEVRTELQAALRQ